MKVSEVAVRRGVTFTMAFLMIVGFGLYSLSQLQIDLYPDVALPTVVVITNYTGASPEDIETLVTRPIEGAVASVKDAEEIREEARLLIQHWAAPTGGFILSDYGDGRAIGVDLEKKQVMLAAFMEADPWLRQR